MGRRLNFTLEEIKDICSSYNNGISRNKLKKKYHCSDNAILRILKQNNIKIRSIQEANGNVNYTLNVDFFRTPSHNLGYLLGFLAADGTVHMKENMICLELQQSDKEILGKLRIVIGNNRPISEYTTKRGYKNSKLYFYNREVKDILKTYRIVPNKTYDDYFGFPDKLPKEYLPDYLRGFTDGDGCFKITGVSPTWQIDSTSRSFIEEWKKYLDSLGIYCMIASNKKTNVILYRLYCYGNEKVKKIYNLLYGNNPELFLVRKKERVEEILEI